MSLPEEGLPVDSQIRQSMSYWYERVLNLATRGEEAREGTEGTWQTRQILIALKVWLIHTYINGYEGVLGILLCTLYRIHMLGQLGVIHVLKVLRTGNYSSLYLGT